MNLNETLVIGTALLAGAVIMIGVTRIETNFAMLCMAAPLIGFSLNGSAVGMNALAAAFYPTTARATGVSWMTGFGRAGATLSAIVGGLLLGWGWKADSVFGVLSVPVLVCVLAMLLFGRHERRRTEAPGFAAASGPADVDGIRSALTTGSNKEPAR
jgi:AAHS family 4-hydroxybenzoate transporter-like MFS transporter